MTIFACNKDDDPIQPRVDQLPPATTSGANTAGCIINGKVLITKNGINSTSGFPVFGLKYFVGPNFGTPNFDEYFSLDIQNLKNKKGIDYTIYVHLNNMILGAGLYNVGQSNGENYIDGPNNPQIIVNEINENVYTGKKFWSSPNSGTINITRFDYSNKIISGVFSCTLYNKDNPTETIQVTDGRFDINLVTLNK